MHSLLSVDQSLFFLINGHSSPWLDWIMWHISQPLTWVPLYLTLAYVLVRNHLPTRWFWILLSFGLLIFLCDFVVTHAIKNTVQRLRPSHDPAIQHLVHLLKDASGQIYKGGSFGFFSSHASNHMGMAVLFVLWIRPRHKWITALLLLWASIIAVSRIYLGVHYPSDILAGMAYGAFMAVAVYQLFNRLIPRSQP